MHDISRREFCAAEGAFALFRPDRAEPGLYASVGLPAWAVCADDGAAVGGDTHTSVHKYVDVFRPSRAPGLIWEDTSPYFWNLILRARVHKYGNEFLIGHIKADTDQHGAA